LLHASQAKVILARHRRGDDHQPEISEGRGTNH
jgi:hypothetical protein